jgi:hypothetical protein
LIHVDLTIAHEAKGGALELRDLNGMKKSEG